MASFVFNHVKSKIVKGEINFNVSDGIYRLALVDATIFEDIATYSKRTLWSEISHSEITTTANAGYTQKPLNSIITTNTITDSVGLDSIIISANNVIYPISTITAYGIVIFQYNTGFGSTDGLLISAIDIRTAVDGETALTLPVKSVEGVLLLS